jgi:hypothetical protein
MFMLLTLWESIASEMGLKNVLNMQLKMKISNIIKKDFLLQVIYKNNNDRQEPDSSLYFRF